MKLKRIIAFVLAIVMAATTFCFSSAEAMAAESLGEVNVTGSAVNVRSGPGTGYERYGVVYRGEAYNAVGSAKDSAGILWYKIEYSKSPDGTGYITSQHATLRGASNNVSVQGEKIGTITVTGGVVNIRTGAGTNCAKIGTLSRGTVRDVYSTATDSNGVVWYKIVFTDAIEGYITSQYSKFTAVGGNQSSSTTTSTTTTKATTTTTSTQPPSSPSIPAKYANALRPNGSTKASYFKQLSNVQQFIDSIALLAVYEMEQNDILASVTIAQAILESASGKSNVAQNKNNLFGVMTGPTTYKSYNSVQASFAGHSSVLKQSYYNNSSRRVIGNKSYTSTINALVGVYATDPNYGTKLKAIVKSYNLTKYDSMTCADFGYNPSTSSNAPSSSSANKVKVTCSALRVRSGAGTNYTKLGVVYSGSVYTYTATKTVNGTVWYCINFNGTAGWISGDYARRV